MHRLILIVFCLISSQLIAQPKPERISVGYYGHYLIQPGIKISSVHSVRDWESKNSVRLKSLTLSPQLAIFSRPGISTSYLINAETGYRFKQKERKRYSIVSIGLGYMIESEILSFSVDLGSGNTSDKQRNNQHFFMPTLNYEFGSAINTNVNWYTKYSLGTKLFGEDEDALTMFLELGISMILKPSNQ